MEPFYDRAEAKKALNVFRSQKLADSSSKVQVATLVKEENWENDVEIVAFREPTCWRLLWRTDGEYHAADEELMVFVVGVVQSMDLPPLTVRQVASSGKDTLKHLRQKVVITGLGSDEFSLDIEGVVELYALFTRHLGNNAKYELPKLPGDEALEFANRYFTSRREAPGALPAHVNPAIDEHGAIARVNEVNGQYVYLEDNKVLYRETTVKDGKASEVTVNPRRFAVGDIVEVGFSMIAVPVKAGVVKLMLQLRSLSLLDGSFTQRALKTRMKEEATEGRQKNTVKRPACFEDEEVLSTRRKFTRMSLSGAKVSIGGTKPDKGKAPARGEAPHEQETDMEE